MNTRAFSRMVVVMVAAWWLALGTAAGQRAAGQAQDACPVQPPSAFHQCAKEKMKTFNPPRTSDGKPDMQGYWERTVGSLDIEQPSQPRTGDRGDPAGGRGTLIVDPADGKIPYQPWAAEQRRTNFARFIDPMVGCTMLGSPRGSYISPYTLIVQSPGYLAFLQEDMHQFRIVPTDGRPHIGKRIRLWGGDFRGTWEGNTFVMDVTNLNGLTWLASAGDFYSEDVHVVERFTMISRNQIHWEAMVEDSNVYMRPFTLAAALRRNADPNFELLEEGCWEGETDADHIQKAGRQFFRGARRPQ